MDELPHDIFIKGTHVSPEILAHESSLKTCLKTTDTMTLLKNKMELLYLHVLVSVLQLDGHNIIYLILKVVIAMVFMIQMERQSYRRIRTKVLSIH